MEDLFPGRDFKAEADTGLGRPGATVAARDDFESATPPKESADSESDSQDDFESATPPKESADSESATPPAKRTRSASGQTEQMEAKRVVAP